MAIHEINDETPNRYDLREILRKTREDEQVDDPRVIAASKGPYSTLEEVRVSDVLADAYQRPIEDRRIRRMVRDWRPLDVGHPIISRRRDGSYFVIDGQHRIIAIQRLGSSVPQTVKAIVWHGLTRTQEAEMFYRTQSSDNRLAVVPEHTHNARLHADDAQAHRIQTAVERAGFRLLEGTQSFSGRIKAVKQLYIIEERYGVEILEASLTALARAWGVKTAPEASAITGMAQFMAMFPDANYTALTRRIAKRPIEHWLIDADTKGKLTDPPLRNKTDRVSWMLHRDYNAVHRANRLPDFHQAIAQHRTDVRSQASKAWRGES